ncbi:PREDICTED: cell number regulator 8 [Tarenaya hassleriana]|uniref:cell number regulator 8 n=1 Tax=Tarenaya hassleriana TaxID=28532 RepID=UPI00053CA98D|nr:PREDICTED: cell number regulator 8 [Tarenaya hassleriana]
MAAEDKHDSHRSEDGDESSPLLEGNDGKMGSDGQTKAVAPATEGYSWTADGLPLSHGSVMGEPVERNQWDSGLFSCLGRNDEFCSSDLEVCLLGSVAPCVLYGSNVERLGSAPGTFTTHCLPYFGLYLMGNSFFGWNCLAPWFSYPIRSAIRRKFNLEGSFEALNRSCGCCGSCIEDEMQREHCETTCDFMTHVMCHTCALCQEGRELRRRLPHPGFKAQPVVVVVPPPDQTMGRH